MEYFLITVIFAFCILLGWKERESRLERSKLINALMAKNNQEMVNLEIADKTQIKANVPVENPDLVPIENLDQEAFEKIIKQNG